MPSATAAAGPDEEPVGLRLDTIHEDALKAVCGWLLGIELARLAQTCRKFRNVVREWKGLWTSMARLDFDETLVSVAAKWQAEAGAAAGVAAQVAHTATEGLPLYRRAHAMSAARNAVWTYCPPDEHRLGPGGIEGHALCTWRDRWIICAGGYTHHGLDANVYAVDTQGLAEHGHKYRWEEVITTGDEEDQPQPSYGYTLTEVSGDRLVKYGGVLFGGYMHSVNWCHVLHLSLSGDKVCGRWERLKGPSMHPAAYHGAVALEPTRDCLLIYGGMDQNEGVGEVTVIDTLTGETFQPEQEAEEGATLPIGRYGAAVHAIGPNLWVIGGCDGGDLRREGDDFNDVHTADISAVLEERRLVWRAHEPIEVPVYCTGREMASTVWGTKILLHGGSCDKAEIITTEVGDKVAWFDTKRLAFGQPKIVGHFGPIAALSVEAVVIGPRLYVHGGWCRQGLIDSLLQLHLGYADDELPDLPDFKEVQCRIVDNEGLAQEYETVIDTGAPPGQCGRASSGARYGDALSQLVRNLLGAGFAIRLEEEEEA